MGRRWKGAYQLGIVVRDLEAAMDHFGRAGVGPFEEGESAKIVERRVRGRSADDVKVRGATAKMGAVEFELLQPVSGDGVPAEMLADRGEGAVHLCAYTDDLRGESAEMEAAGFPVISSGVLADGGKFAFFDTRAIGGLMLGLYEPGADLASRRTRMTERSNPQEGATLDSLVRELAEGPNIAHLATLLRDGSPHSAAVWTAVEGERLVFYKSAASVGLENVRRDPRVAISMVAHDDPYRTCQVRGRVVETRGEPEASRWLNCRAIDYTGAPYPSEEIPLEGVLLVVEVERQRHHSSSIFKDRLPSRRS